MKPIVIGAVVAGLIIVAFAAGGFVEQDTDGPVEQLGEAVDEATGN